MSELPARAYLVVMVSDGKWAVWFGRVLYTVFDSYGDAVNCASEVRLLVAGRHKEEIAVRKIAPTDLPSAAAKIPEA